MPFNPKPRGQDGNGWKHGMVGTPTYTSWAEMKRRCNSNYPNYGTISYDPRWEKFENFLADMGERPAGTTIDRWPNPHGNYEPGNCRWATKKEQNNNRGEYNRTLELGCFKATVAEWGAALGVRHDTMLQRIKLGWPAYEVIYGKVVAPSPDAI